MSGRRSSKSSRIFNNLMLELVKFELQKLYSRRLSEPDYFSKFYFLILVDVGHKIIRSQGALHFVKNILQLAMFTKCHKEGL